MTLHELKGKYARLSDEIDALAGAGNEARLLRLMNELDEVHRELAELRRRTLAAPTLRDAVSWSPNLNALPRARQPFAVQGALAIAAG